MLHYARRSVPGTDLFHTWEEAAALWGALGERVPGIVSMTLMPDHLHLLVRDEVDGALAAALRSFGQWRNHRRGELGPVVRRGDAPEVVKGSLKIQRSVRYIALNPCRAQLVDDPLAWPFSTHRDRTGLALQPLVRRVSDPVREHRYVSADPSSAVEGTPLPLAASRVEDADLDAVIDAVSAITRSTPAALRRRGRARSLLLRAAVELCALPPRELAGALSCDRATIYRARRAPGGAEVRLVERVLGDPRFTALVDGDLRRVPGFRGRWGRRVWRARGPIAS